MVKVTVKQPERRMESLPMLSTVVSRLLALNSDDEHYFEQVLSLSQEDPGFAVHLIKMSNSATLASVEPIVSLRDAVVRLGTRNISSLITSLALLRVFEPSSQKVKELWLHAIQVAITARVIACTTTAFNVNPEHAYLCGLLHDIGRFSQVSGGNEKNKLDSDTGYNIEQDNAFVHASLGARICQTWALPEILCHVVEFHHDYELSNDLQLQPKTLHLIKITQQANLFSTFITELEIPEPDTFNEDLSEQIEQVCSPLSQPAPVDANQLEMLMMPILQEAQSVAKGMGIG